MTAVWRAVSGKRRPSSRWRGKSRRLCSAAEERRALGSEEADDASDIAPRRWTTTSEGDELDVYQRSETKVRRRDSTPKSARQSVTPEALA